MVENVLTSFARNVQREVRETSMNNYLMLNDYSIQEHNNMNSKYFSSTDCLLISLIFIVEHNILLLNMSIASENDAITGLLNDIMHASCAIKISWV